MLCGEKGDKHDALQRFSEPAFSAPALAGPMIWIDIEDLFVHFHAGGRPSGIQRLSLDLTAALIAEGGGRVHVCRHGPGPSGFCALDWDEARAELDAAIAGDRKRPAAAPAQAVAAVPVPPPPIPQRRERVSAARRAVRRLPHQILFPLARAWHAERRAVRALLEIVLAQIEAIRAGGEILAQTWRLLVPSGSSVSGAALERQAVEAPATAEPEPEPQPEPAPPHEIRLAGRPIRFEPGDVLIAAGATWQFRNYAARVARLQSTGTRVVVLAHDMVPLLFPEWSVRETTERFEIWAREVLAVADMIFTNSQATARDVTRYAARQGLAVAAPVPLPIGASFAPARRAQALAEAGTDGMPHPRPYLLFVSTIEPRKNHTALLRLWRRFLNTMDAAEVPDLVFAGKVGWLAHDVVAQAENADWFAGKLRLIEGPDDATLAALYRGCLFTVYPSLYEGWGLPVTESLSFGKPVAAADRGAIPEAGGPFCAYFDPDDLANMEAVIGGLIRDPRALAALAERIEAEFDPPAWSDTARVMLASLGSVSARPQAPDIAAEEIRAISVPTEQNSVRSSPAGSPVR